MSKTSLASLRPLALKSEAEFKVRQDESKRKTIEIAKNAILNHAENDFISLITGLNIEKIEQLRQELKNTKP